MKQPSAYNPHCNLAHVYERAVNGFNVFYTVQDCLVFFTVLSVLAFEYHIHIIALCIMLNHFHMALAAPSDDLVSKFMKQLNSKFKHLWNEHYGLHDRLFDPYGISNKKGDKAARTTLSYIANNPVVAKLVAKAELWQWGFLRYIPNCVNSNSTFDYSDREKSSHSSKGRPHPFSEKLLLALASRPMRYAVAAVKAQKNSHQPLSYSFLDRISSNLNESQKKQLTDFIINEYMPIDFSASSLFGSTERMIQSFSLVTGSEYDLKEEFLSGTDRVYLRLYKRVLELGYSGMIEVFALPVDKLVTLSNELLSVSGASAFRVNRFLHIKDRGI